MGDYTHFGSTVAKGGDGRYYWTQHFARPFASVEEPCMALPDYQPSTTSVTRTATPTQPTRTPPTRTTPLVRTTLITTVLTVVYTVFKR